jgi:SAM-dependent methyltransferase
MTLIEILSQRTRSSRVARMLVSCTHRLFLNPTNKWRHSQKEVRFLEIGPGRGERLPGFETLDLISRWKVDYVADASKSLPFRDNVFDLVYASHIIEHVPWYELERVIREWARIIKPGGALEVWAPDAVKIARAFADAEENGCTSFHNDGWWRFNEEQDPCKWAAGRTFTYGDGTGAHNHHNWHRALLSPRYLRLLLERAGLTNVQSLDRSQVRGHDHGMRGIKPMALIGPAPLSGSGRRLGRSVAPTCNLMLQVAEGRGDWAQERHGVDCLRAEIAP